MHFGASLLGPVDIVSLFTYQKKPKGAEVLTIEPFQTYFNNRNDFILGMSKHAFKKMFNKDSHDSSCFEKIGDTKFETTSIELNNYVHNSFILHYVRGYFPNMQLQRKL